MNWYRKGNREWMLEKIQSSPQSEATLADLRAALVEELGVKRTRYWLAAALRQRIEWMGARVAVLEEIEVMAFRSSSQSTVAMARYFAAASDFLILAPDKGSARKVSADEAKAWLENYPGDRVYTYSVGGHTLYFGELPEAAERKEAA